MMSARFESPSHQSLSNQYADIQIASNQYAIIPGVKPPSNYSSPNEIPIPTSNAHYYKEFVGATQLMEIDQQQTTTSSRQSIRTTTPPPPPPPPSDVVEF